MKKYFVQDERENIYVYFRIDFAERKFDELVRLYSKYCECSMVTLREEAEKKNRKEWTNAEYAIIRNGNLWIPFRTKEAAWNYIDNMHRMNCRINNLGVKKMN